MIGTNSEFSKVQKLYYQKCSLTGEALNLINSLKLEEANYDSAIKTLSDRYDNKGSIITSLLNKSFSVPDVTLDNLTKLREFTNTVRSVLDSLNNIGCDTSQWDTLLIHCLLQKLSPSFRKDWESKLESNSKYPTYVRFESFLYLKLNILEAVQLSEKASKDVSTSSKALVKERVKTIHTVTQANKLVCPCCAQEHYLFACPKFSKLSVSDRHKLRKDKNLCINCLSPSHSVKTCRNPHRCRHCGKPHHLMFHFETKQTEDTSISKISVQSKSSSIESKSEESSSSQQAPTLHTHLNASPSRAAVLLATALVQIRSPSGRSATVRALIDPCSETSVVSGSVVQTLRLTRHRDTMAVDGLGGVRTASLRYSTEFNILPCSDPTKSVYVNAYILQTITSYEPKPFTTGSHPELHGLELADPEPERDIRIELLIGADIYGQILLPGLVQVQTHRNNCTTHNLWLDLDR